MTVTVGDIAEGFYVADDGSGIPESAQEAVFREGFTTSTGSTGLGLQIVETVAEAHGWNASVAESATGGARFEFTNVQRPGE